MSYCFSDEGALVKGAKQLGFSFNVRTPTSVIINVVSLASSTVFCYRLFEFIESVKI